MKKLVVCLVAGVVLFAGVAYAGDSVCLCGHCHESGSRADATRAALSSGPLQVAYGAVSTAYGAGETCLEAVGSSLRAPMQAGKDAVNGVCRGLSDGDTLFWD